MVGARLSAWDPSSPDLFALHCSQLELWRVSALPKGRVSQAISVSKLANHVSCLDWQKVQEGSILAHGSTTGSIGLVKWSEHDNHEVLLHESSSTIKRTCNGLAWNYVSSNFLASCTENYKTESTVALWDVAAVAMMKLPIVESVTTISFLPHSPHLIGVGTAMGFAKLFDTRLPSSSVMSWLSHPSNRPRKIQGMRSDPLSAHHMATFSDANGDAVKVWDLRYLAENHLSKSKPLPVVTIVPHGPTHMAADGNVSIGSISYPAPPGSTPSVSAVSPHTAAVVHDVAWSPTRAGLLAVATSAQKAVLFFKCNPTSALSLQEETASTSTSVPAAPSIPQLAQPAFTLHTGESVRSLSWQYKDLLPRLRRETNILGSAGVGVIPVQPQTVVQEASWESFPNAQLMVEFATLTTSASSSLSPNVSHVASRRLLGVTSSSVVDSDVREANSALAVSPNHLVHMPDDRLHARHLTAKVAIPILTAHADAKHIVAVEEVLAAVVEEVETLMQDRARAGYSTDCAANLETITEEVDAIFRHLQLAWLQSLHAGTSHNSIVQPPYFSAHCAVTRKEVESGVLRLGHMQELYRVWLWLDRIVSDMAFKKSGPSHQLHMCGVAHINGEKEAESEVKAKQSLLGIKYFASKNRAAIHKVCGWMGMLESLPRLTHGRGPFPPNPATFSSPVIYEANQLHAFLEEEQTCACFERVVALCVWHGHMDLAVTILSTVIEQYENHCAPTNSAKTRPSRNSSLRSMDGSALALDEHLENATFTCTNDEDALLLEGYDPEQAVDWDHVITGDYVKILATVAACLAGYHLDSDRVAADDNRAYLSWIAMCKYAIQQLQSVPRVHSEYLISACYFLMVYLDPHKIVCYDYFEDQLRQMKRSSAPFHGDHGSQTAHAPSPTPKATKAAKPDSGNMYNSDSYGNEQTSIEAMLAGHEALFLHAGHQLVLFNPWINLADRLAYAASYLDSEELHSYVDYMNVYAVCHGVLEGLVLTGFTSDAYTILQQYVERTDDLQSVALIVSPFAAYYNTNNLSNTPAAIPRSQSSSNNMAALTKGPGKSKQAAVAAASVSKSLLQQSNEWILTYRTLLNKWTMFVERAHFDIELNSLSKSYGHGEKSESKQPSISQEFKLANHLLESQRCNVKLKCRFCTKMLPLEDFPVAGLDALRSQKHVLNYCNHCKNALPRCYICQLHLGLLNPYVHAIRLSDRNYKDSLSRQDASCGSAKKAPAPALPTTLPTTAASAVASAAASTGGGAATAASAASTGKPEEEGIFNGLDFGRWVLFCQHCRHGGHAICLTSWFNGSAGIGDRPQESLDGKARKQNMRLVCGVNGCNCQCQLYA